MRATDIKKVGVVGCGLMGSGIAEVCARSGVAVLVQEVNVPAAEFGEKRIITSLDRAAQSGKITEELRDATLNNLSFTSNIEDLFDCDLVIEAVIENESLKTELFIALDRIVTKENAILATNTSSIPVMKLGMMTQRPSQVVGIHFFNPVPVLRLVEIVPSLLTSDETVTNAKAFAEQTLNKRVVLAKDRAGFIVNSLLVPYILSAIRMLESGYASADDIDTGMVEGCAHPMGPLRLADLIGLDTTASVAESLYAEFKEPLFAAPPLLCRMVDAGLLGRKAGRGFYEYLKKQ
jgi:3-hydroxybutyryl-CoA dehydrogenase